MCLSPTDQWHGCQHSSSQGTLDAVFLRLDGLGVSEAQQVIVSGSDSMSINYPYCVKNAGGPGVSSCQGFDMSTPVLDYGWDVAFAVSSAGSNTSWSGSPSASLGCFYLSGLSSFDMALNGWTVGLKYSNTTKGSASMVKPICSDLVPFNSTVREFNQISTQVGGQPLFESQATLAVMHLSSKGRAYSATLDSACPQHVNKYSMRLALPSERRCWWATTTCKAALREFVPSWR